MITKALAKSLLFAFIGAVICAILWLGVSFEHYDLFQVKGPPERLKWGMEAIRWTIYVTAILIIYQVVSVLAFFIPKWTGRVITTSAKMVKGEKQGAQRATSSFGLLKYVNKLVAISVTGFIALVLARIWIFESSTLGKQATDAGPPEAWRVHVERGLWLGVVLGLLIALEKLFIAFIKNKFKHSAMAERLEGSEFRMHVIETLHKAVSPQITVTSPHLEASEQRTRRVSQIPEEKMLRHDDSPFVISSAKQAKMIAKRIFRQIQRNGLVTAKEVAAYFKPEEAYRAFVALDKEHSGELDEFEFCSAVIEAYRESANLMQMVEDGTSIIRTLDFWLCLAIVFPNVSFYIATYLPSGYSWLAKVGGLVFGFAYLLGGTIAETCTCLIFILIQHPYDVGDTIIIDNQRLKVMALDLYVSTFVRCDNGAIQYRLNKNVAPKNIYNPQRTRYDYDVRRVKVSATATAMSQLFSIRDTLKKWLMERDPEFTGNVIVKPVMETVDPTGRQVLKRPADIKVTIEAQYRIKLEDSHRRRERQREFADKVQECLNEANIRTTSVH